MLALPSRYTRRMSSQGPTGLTRASQGSGGRTTSPRASRPPDRASASRAAPEPASSSGASTGGRLWRGARALPGPRWPRRCCASGPSERHAPRVTKAHRRTPRRRAEEGRNARKPAIVPLYGPRPRAASPEMDVVGPRTAPPATWPPRTEPGVLFEARVRVPSPDVEPVRRLSRQRRRARRQRISSSLDTRPTCPRGTWSSRSTRRPAPGNVPSAGSDPGSRRAHRDSTADARP